MPDLEKVIAGMEHCKADKCSGCPYEDTSAPIGKFGTDELVACEPVLFADALDLLKAQEADIKVLCEKYAELLDRTLEAVPPEKRELPYGMYDAVKYEYKCGVCGCGLMRNEKWRANYCPECGRAVKWE